ncbi:MAG: Stp1/IreP family PP2C-type Ser/Thr phosphatase [Lachnospirales bacterium]
MEIFSKSHIGNVRQNNEDSFLIEQGAIGNLPNVFGVADGMGGHKAGEVASRECIDNFVEFVKNTKKENVIDILSEGIAYSNEEVFKKSMENSELFQMGTTFSVLTIIDNIVYCGHVGDSRIYSFINEKLKLESTDHTLVNEYVKNGIFTAEEAEISVMKNVVTRAVGVREEIDIDTFSFECNKGDQLLICSDGLTTHLGDDILYEVFNSVKTMEEKVNDLVDRALNEGGIDNITIIMIKA